MARVVMPLPHRDFDPSEVALSWRVLTALGHEVRFATPDGAPAIADAIMLDGIGLDPWSRMPGLRRIRLIGLLLRANRDARRAHAELERDPQFLAPLSWDQARVDDFDGLLLPGGHRARGMRDYLESAVLQRLVVAFFAADKPVGAICHGVLLAARSRRDDGTSILYGRRTTSLTWAQERAASALAHVGRRWDRDYYRTYVEEPGQPEGYMSVEAEVRRALASPQDYVDVPRDAPDFRRKTSGLARDTIDDARPAWVVSDGKYVSARWPGDAHSFAARFADLLG
jgi:putative intracellular protease/amidase